MKINTGKIAGTVGLIISLLEVGRAAPLGTAFTYQGRLQSAGSAASGTYDFQFTLYDASNAGTAVGATIATNGVAVSGGLFTVSLDFGGSAFAGDARWLAIAVRTNGGSSFTALLPRQPLAASAYALFAPSAGSAGSATVAATATTATTVANNAVTAAGISSGQVVKSLNNLRDNVTLEQGANVTITTGGQTLTLAGPTDWHIGGNSGTLPGSNFLGTTDNQPLELRVGNNRVLRFEQSGDGFNTIGGSFANTVASGVVGSTISGGGNTNGSLGNYSPNSIAANYSVVGGGAGNSIQSGAFNSAINGGVFNSVKTNAFDATIGGGGFNLIGVGGARSSIAGGYNNSALSDGAAIGGGWYNRVEQNTMQAAIGGGSNNVIQPGAALATISGGLGNVIQSNSLYGVIGGGVGNVISNNSRFATVPGGSSNVAGQNFAFAAGNRAKANHQGAFVWADSQSADFASTGTNQFLVRASGGFGINKANPSSTLDVNGTVTASSFVGSGAGLSSISAAALPANVAFLNSNETFTGGISFLEPVNFQNAIRMNDHNMFFKADANHGVGWFGSGTPFGGIEPNGPVLFGYGGGLLGTEQWGTEKAALQWDANGNVMTDPANLNSGSLTPGLTFGSGSGEGISSKRTSGSNQYGLDFYTGFAKRMTINNAGNVGIGTSTPSVPLEVAGDARIGGSVRVPGMIRIGSETESAPPNYPSGSQGLVLRRVSCTSSAIWTVVARTDNMSLVRDGTSSGLYFQFNSTGRFNYSALGINRNHQVVAMNSSGDSTCTGCYTVVFDDSQRIVHYDISFGNSYNNGHMCHVVLDRYDDGTTSDNYLVGTLTSTYNQ